MPITTPKPAGRESIRIAKMRLVQSWIVDADKEGDDHDRAVAIQTQWNRRIAFDLMFPPCVSLSEAHRYGMDIVAACNAHARLVEALAGLVDSLDSENKAAPWAVRTAKAALAQATEDKG